MQVSDSSLHKDRTVKLPIYARQGVVEVWIVDLAGQQVLVHTHPQPDGTYRHARTVGANEPLSPVTLPELTITVEEILGL